MPCSFTFTIIQLIILLKIYCATFRHSLLFEYPVNINRNFNQHFELTNFDLPLHLQNEELETISSYLHLATINLANGFTSLK